MNRKILFYPHSPFNIFVNISSESLQIQNSYIYLPYIFSRKICSLYLQLRLNWTKQTNRFTNFLILKKHNFFMLPSFLAKVSLNRKKSLYMYLQCISKYLFVYHHWPYFFYFLSKSLFSALLYKEHIVDYWSHIRLKIQRIDDSNYKKPTQLFTIYA